MAEGKAKMRRGILFLIEEVRRLVVNDADANEVLEILEELEASTKTRLRSCACGGGDILADGLINGWIGEREGKIGILGILVDYGSVGSVQLDKHVRIVDVDESLPTDEPQGE